MIEVRSEGEDGGRQRGVTREGVNRWSCFDLFGLNWKQSDGPGKRELLPLKMKAFIPAFSIKVLSRLGGVFE